jgi:hypothetical protein
MLEPAEEIAEYMGLPPISNEVADMEEQDSQKRLSRFAELLPYIESHSDIVARIATAAYSIDGDDEDLSALSIDKDSLERVTSLFRLVAVTSTISCISSLYNLELLESKAEHNE